jgi:exodeoxyribonuclease VII large subunit
MLAAIEDRQVAVRHILKSHAFNRPLDLLHRFSQRVDELERAMTKTSEHALAVARLQCGGLTRRLLALDARSVLKRGFAMVYRNGTLITSAAAAGPGDALNVRMADGDIHSIVTPHGT